MEINKIIENLELMKAEVEWEYPIDYAATIDEAIELIKERKSSHWECFPDNTGYGNILECQNCGAMIYDKTPDGCAVFNNYCPNCGADMRGE